MSHFLAVWQNSGVLKLFIQTRGAWAQCLMSSAINGSICWLAHTGQMVLYLQDAVCFILFYIYIPATIYMMPKCEDNEWKDLFGSSNNTVWYNNQNTATTTTRFEYQYDREIWVPLWHESLKRIQVPSKNINRFKLVMKIHKFWHHFNKNNKVPDFGAQQHCTFVNASWLYAWWASRLLIW